MIVVAGKHDDTQADMVLQRQLMVLYFGKQQERRKTCFILLLVVGRQCVGVAAVTWKSEDSNQESVLSFCWRALTSNSACQPTQ